ncbi:MAG: PQQ-binding-like beta-propeller repeat protein [Planctomycetaceae bacterium]|nr:PQQ-binding-like beta-propeller repeat protein [Planctomycetaceae bacterium]
MSETKQRSWSRDPLNWFAVIFVPLWLLLLLGWVNGEWLVDRVPVLSLGILDTVLIFAAFTTAFWLVLALIIRMTGRKRWISLVSFFALMGGMVVGLPRFFELDLDGDIRPLGLRLKQASGLLPIEVTTAFAPLKASETSFTQFLGPNRDLNVPWLEISDDAQAIDCQVVWRRPMGAGWSGFIAVDGLAFTMEQHGNREVVAAYRVNDGKRVWVHEATRRHFHPAGGTGPRSTPTFFDNRLYTLGGVGHLLCLEANTGRVLWEHDLTQEFGIPVVVSNPDSDERQDVEQSKVLWGRAAAPLIVDDLVVVPVGGAINSPQVTLVAFDRVTGEKRWQNGDKSISYGSPTLAKLLGKNQILLTTESHVCGFDSENGQELWSYARPGDSSGDANTSQPVAVAEDQVLVTKEYGVGGELLKLSRSTEGDWKVERVWENRRVLKTKLTIAAVRNEHAYAISSGILECVEWKTGIQAWRGARVRHGQLLMTRKHLVIMTEDGDLTISAIDPEDYMPLLTKDAVLSGRCWNTLCIYDDLLLARSDREAVCVRLPRAGKRTEIAEADDTSHPRANAAFRTQGVITPVGNRLQETEAPKAARVWMNEFETANAADKREAALAALDGLLAQYPDEVFAYYQRGCLKCWMGDFQGSVDDFDRYISRRPEVEQRLWERGISQYLVGQYQAGAKQFELYQTYHDNDVENSVWRYLCQVKVDGKEVAKQQLLPIRNDPRVPLMDIYRLFQGQGSVDDVLAAISAGDPQESELASRRFYGHYYLGLYFDSLGDREQAIKHVKLALEVPAESPRVSRYMWDVAKVHLKSIEGEQAGQ